MKAGRARWRGYTTAMRLAWPASGLARLNPADRDVPEIGDELAVARALSDLGHQLLDTAAGDIEQITHRPVHLSP